MPVLFSFSEPKEAVKIVWECGPDASVAVKHCSLMARQRYRFCDLLQPSVVVLFFDFRSVVVIDLSLSNSHPNIPRRQFLNVVFGRGVWSERREKRLCRSHRLGKGYTDGDSPFRGVYRVPTSRKWEARLGREGSPTIHLGTYYTAEDAARAYDIISIKLKGGEAITNFDWNSYETEGIMESVISQSTDGSIILQKEEKNKETEASPQNSSSVQCHSQPPSIPSICRCCHNQILTPTNPHALGAIADPAGNSGSNNSIVNDAVQFRNENVTQQQPRPLQTQRQVCFNDASNQNLVNNNQLPNHNAAQQQSLQTPMQVSFNNGFNQTLVNNNYSNNTNTNTNNQFLPQGSNLALPATGIRNLELEKCVRFPDWRSGFGKKLLGGNLELESLSNIAALSLQALPQVTLNGSTGATQLHSPALQQSYEHQNLNSCSSDSFQNPVSEPNNNGFQSQLDLDMIDYLNRSYIEDTDFTCDYDMFSALNGGR
ncbi:AP2-like factor [Vigna unguiculata]|uniref:AP2-like factor n=1 Tax=Vigna unguiculata TaxID=3917 RepID=A0A4D6KWW5_VIGUN|nr:AP2-like factor [Vigna unguiculata]